MRGVEATPRYRADAKASSWISTSEAYSSRSLFHFAFEQPLLPQPPDGGDDTALHLLEGDLPAVPRQNPEDRVPVSHLQRPHQLTDGSGLGRGFETAPGRFLESIQLDPAVFVPVIEGPLRARGEPGERRAFLDLLLQAARLLFGGNEDLVHDDQLRIGEHGGVVLEIPARFIF